MMGQLSHLDADGHARMIDVGSKPDTERAARAEATVQLSPSTAAALFAGDLPKGDALAVARIAGIQAAKKTADLIPLCHPLALTSVQVDVERCEEGVRITARVATRGPTGVEMEAMSAASVAALAVYDMVKGLERGAVIGPVQLLEKSGGRSGEWVR
ncbi:MAG: cyclic pyranopterin monophosphate synthase MoaC [Acidimicrobiia bacterium]|nr:cyclic pyranopterin monophosphate synthase MoaC [Acidimicrobiia bacterium]